MGDEDTPTDLVAMREKTQDEKLGIVFKTVNLVRWALALGIVYIATMLGTSFTHEVLYISHSKTECLQQCLVASFRLTFGRRLEKKSTTGRELPAWTRGCWHQYFLRSGATADATSPQPLYTTPV